ncbi:uncharacterized protein A4U43_C07F23330 [Asparagus officinalis]|uniref:Calcium-binding EF hand family protein n=1 Tax=Asparagus officinalis TaxID=4686 RepID=A0A5P1EE90_ASPOF|nr:epidermal growth factor receptor substrate 15-like [Asparagus officinalis]ONK64215.1 uncharacterized protein A4U43_C07F23330 [Asparagus officinalis]
MAAARPPQSPNMNDFEVMFKRADLDQDGRISGSEAVAFFRGSNLPQHVLAQIWMHANHNQAAFLGRPEFFNALRLITVAQSGRELTPDIVKAALGPAAAKIPAPQINPVPAPSAQMSSMASSTTQANAMPPSTQVGAVRPSVYQNPGVRGQQALPNMGMNQQSFPSPNNHLMRPPQATATTVSLPMQGLGQAPSGGGITGPRLPSSSAPNLSTDWLGRNSGAAARSTAQLPVRGAAPASQNGSGLEQLGMASGVAAKQKAPILSSSVQPNPVDSALPSSQPASIDSKALVLSGNGFASDSAFGEDMFSAAPQAKQEASTSSFSSSSLSGSSNIISASQNLTKPGQPNPMHLYQGGSQLQSQPLVKQNQRDTAQGTLALATSNLSVGPSTPISSDSQVPWPKITQFDIRKYTKVFVEVDKDRDGKITGEEARNLFLSWRLPREVLKQVWDLSDQDNDSMLSLREFCTALYLMERYREGRPLPAVLPNSLRFDETLSLATGQSSNAYSGSSWQQNQVSTQQRVPGPRPVMASNMMKPPRAPLPSLPEEPVPQKQKARVPVLEKNLVNQLSEDEQKTINLKFQEATDADKKVQELEKEILDSKEKTEFYRAKMQELVLYKSRCDNRLNEIVERISTDKREVESLARKYEDKYKNVGDVASKLTLDEATFRDIQDKKLELYNAIVKMEQGGTADGVLQDRVDKIQSDLEELVKTLNERCKQYGLRAKPTSLVELPFGWQPGVQESAADWDEDWDKFNDEGFAIIKELTIEVENTVAKPKQPPVRSDKPSAAEISTVPSSSNDEKKTESGKHEVSTISMSSNEEDKAEIPSGNGERATENESTYAHSEDGSARSPHVSPRRSALEISSPDCQSNQHGMHDLSPHAKDGQSDHGGAESTISGDKFPDEPSWGAKFDTDDADSVWDFSSTNTKEIDHDRSLHDSFFGPGDFGLNPIRTGGSPSAESVYGADKKGPFFDSVPSTPLYNSSFSPRFNEASEDHSFSRFDSFNMSDGGLFPTRDFSRFDSMRSTPSLARFDSMRSTSDAPFGGLEGFDSMHSSIPPLGSLQRFDSMRSTSEYGGGFSSFDDTDLFGSTGPFKTSETPRWSSETPKWSSDTPKWSSDTPKWSSETPRRSTDSWNAF